MRKELANDAERNRRDVLVGLLEVVDNLDRAIDAARSAGTSPDDPLLQGVEMVRQQFLAKLEGFGVTRIPTDGRQLRSGASRGGHVVPVDAREDDGRVVGVVRTGTASATRCCGPRSSPSPRPSDRRLTVRIRPRHVRVPRRPSSGHRARPRARRRGHRRRNPHLRIPSRPRRRRRPRVSSCRAGPPSRR